MLSLIQSPKSRQRSCAHAFSRVVLCCAGPCQCGLRSCPSAIGIAHIIFRSLQRQPKWPSRCRPASHPSLRLGRRRPSLGSRSWFAMVSSDTETGGARVGNPSSLPNRPRLLPRLPCSRPEAQRGAAAAGCKPAAEPGSERGAGAWRRPRLGRRQAAAAGQWCV